LDAAAHAKLVSAVEDLLKLSQSGAKQSVLDEQVQQLQAMAQAAGASGVQQEMYNGNFKGHPISGQTKARTATGTVLTLGLLSFNQYAPKDLPVAMSPSAEGVGVITGPFQDLPSTQVLVSTFEVMESPAAGDASDAPKGTGLKGRSLAIAEATPAEDNPQRLTVKFVRMQLEPVSKEPQQLKQWLDLFLPHNPTMEPTTGVLTVPMAKPAVGWNDIILVTPKYRVVRGNTGSVTVLERLQ
jgi:hypothetical protein